MRNILKFLPMLIVTILIVLFWLDDFVAFMITIFLFFLFIPAIIAAVYFTIKSYRLSNRWQKGLFVWGIFNLLFFFTYLSFRLPTQRCSATLMAEHYEKNAKEMEEVIEYIDKSLDDSTSIQLEFEHGKASIFHVASKVDPFISCHWDDAEVKKDSLMRVVGLTSDEYDNIHSRLSSIDCIGFKMSKSHLKNETIINFRRVGMGMYSFILYNRPMNQDEKDNYMNDGQYIPYNEKVVFMYDGGAIGRQVFPNDEKEGFLLRHKPW